MHSARFQKVVNLSSVYIFSVAELDEEGRGPYRKRPKLAESMPPPEDHCIICSSAREPTKLLICDGCERVFHLYCLSPPLNKVPRGKWFCPDCIKAKYPTPADERCSFGMTLDEFCEEARLHKLEIVGNQVADLEATFWGLVADGDFLDSVKKRFFHELEMPIAGR